MRAVAGRLTHPHGPGLTDGGRVVACSTAIFLAAAGILHLSAAADHENLPVMMVGFLCVASCQAALAGLLVWRRPGRLLLVAALAVTLGALTTWLISRTLGLPFLPGGHMEPIGFKDGVTVLFEVGTIPGLLLLASRDLTGVQLPSPRLGSQAIAGLGTAAFALFVPAFLLGGGEHHSAAQHAAMQGHPHGTEIASRSDADDHPHDLDAEQLASRDANDHAHTGGASESGGHDHSNAGTGGTAAGALAGLAGGAGGHEHTSGGHQRAAGGGGTGDSSGGGDGHDHGRGNGGDHGRSPHGGGGGGHGRGGGGHGEGGHGEGGGEHGHGAEPPAGEQDGGLPDFNDPGSMSWGEHRLDYEPARPGQNGEVGSGYAMVYRGPSDSSTGTVGHHSNDPCNPTPDQQAAADRLYRATWPAVRQYDNSFGKAIADGFTYLFPLTDRIIHMVNPKRIQDPTILDPATIESFLYVMTDDGLTAIGGMYVMPKFGMPGPQIGGCLTRWHEHAGAAGRLTTAGTQDRTPEMLHVWTYQGLNPWAHYDGRSLSQTWTPGRNVPSVCREAGDASDVCLP